MLEFVCLPWSEVCSARVTSLLLLLLLLNIKIIYGASLPQDRVPLPTKHQHKLVRSSASSLRAPLCTVNIPYVEYGVLIYTQIDSAVVSHHSAPVGCWSNGLNFGGRVPRYRLVCTGVPPPKVCPCGDLTGSGRDLAWFSGV